jgi:hypothetical protein
VRHAIVWEARKRTVQDREAAPHRGNLGRSKLLPVELPPRGTREDGVEAAGLLENRAAVPRGQGRNCRQAVLPDVGNEGMLALDAPPVTLAVRTESVITRRSLKQ